MHIVTAGAKYLDIDAYGGMAAYAELLQMQGKTAQAASSAALNESITKTIQSWGAPINTQYRPGSDDKFTLIDISNPAHFDTLVLLDRVDGVMDHHSGFEAYWRRRLGDGAVIAAVGAACTLVYEAWERAGLVGSMSERSARLLIAGILDNTLNFKAHVTTDRDERAYKALVKLANLPADWPMLYFTECQDTIMANTAGLLGTGSKVCVFPSFAEPMAIGQLAVLDARKLLDRADVIERTMVGLCLIGS